MNAKFVILVVALGLFALSTANLDAQTRSNAGFARHFSSSRSFVRSGNGTFGRGNWNGDWHHHHDGDFGSSIFIGSFGFPFFGFGYPYSYGYPYGYGYGGYYPYGAGYYGGGYYPYGGGYYGAGYNSGYYGGGYGGPGYGNSGYASSYSGGSSVARLQRQLARAGYYRGPIDGIMGPRTHYALRAYRHDHGGGSRETVDRQPY